MKRKLVVNVRENKLLEALRRLTNSGGVKKFRLEVAAESSKEMYLILIFNDDRLTTKNLVDSLVARGIIDDFRTMGVASSKTAKPESTTIH